mmetsp:Transcript_31205/g.85582  ORF Transcript_31205/g.85582 Transcript_31205/m.85582 type:complete len:211 (+) Transcript_31205:533-1165(+)
MALHLNLLHGCGCGLRRVTNFGHSRRRVGDRGGGRSCVEFHLDGRRLQRVEDARVLALFPAHPVRVPVLLRRNLQQCRLLRNLDGVGSVAEATALVVPFHGLQDFSVRRRLKAGAICDGHLNSTSWIAAKHMKGLGCLVELPHPPPGGTAEDDIFVRGARGLVQRKGQQDEREAQGCEEDKSNSQHGLLVNDPECTALEDQGDRAYVKDR